MTTAASGLRELHQLHVEHMRVLDELEAGPRRVKAHQALTSKKQGQVDAEQQSVTNLRKASDDRNLQLKSSETKLIDLRSKLNTASSNREFDIIKGQIDADTVANSVLEDEILELYDRVEGGQKRMGEIEAERETAQTVQERVTAEVAGVEPGLHEEREKLEQAISQSERQLPQDVADRYQRLVRAHGPGAMAEVVDGSCTACSIQISPQYQVELSLGQIVSCNNCGRLLYVVDDDSGD